MCVCGQPATHDPRLHEFLLECHYCANWYHGRCVHVNEVDAMEIVKFACPPCTKQGHTTIKYHDATPMVEMDELTYAPLPIQRHRFDSGSAPSYHASAYSFGSYYEKNTEQFRRTLRAAVFSRSGVRAVAAHEFNASYFKYHAFHEPLLVVDANWTAAGLPRPLPVIGLQDISSMLTNSGSIVRGVDVASQQSFELSASGWASRVSHPSANEPLTAQFRLLETAFRREVAPPVAVAAIDWHYLLPSSNGAVNRDANPEMYGTLCGAGAFIDFTVAPDCKATWLAVSNGDVDVFLIEPTTDTIDSFRAWREDQKVPFASLFLGDRVDQCTKCTVKGGATLVVPSGWIYALYSEHGGSFFTGYFANTPNLATHLDVWLRLEGSSDSRVAPAWRKNSFAHGWALQHPSPAMAPPPPLNAQLWSLVCHYINELSHLDGVLRVSSIEREAIRHGFQLLRQWSGSARSIERLDNVSWLPSSLQDAASLIDQLEQAMLAHPQPADHAKTHALNGAESGYLYGSSQSDDDIWNTSAVSSAFSSVSSSSYHQEPTTSTAANSSLWDYPSYHDASHSAHHHHHSGQATASHSIDPLALPVETQPTFYPSHLGDTPQFSSALHGNGYGASSSSPYSDYLDPRASPSGAQHLGLLGSSHSLLDLSAGLGGLHDAHVRHRASCHRCGNLRKKNVRCPKCPHIFCQKCAEKMVEEHGESVFGDGCPVCKELCCCGKNRTMMCTRKFHCYKKCPATKRQPN